MARMEAILDGQFDLESAELIDEILPQGMDFLSNRRTEQCCFL